MLVSHFSTINTKLKEKPQLLEALERIGERPNVPFSGMKVVELVITDPVSYTHLPLPTKA